MYFWKIDNLKKDLIKGSLAEGEKFKYLLAGTIFLSLMFNLIDVLVFLVPFPLSVLDVYSGMIASAITIFGVICIYKINGGSKGQHILQRIASLGWVTTIRWLVFIGLPISAIYFVFYFILSMLFTTEVSESTTIYDVLIYNLMGLSYFFLLARHIKEVSLKSTTKNPDSNPNGITP